MQGAAQKTKYVGDKGVTVCLPEIQTPHNYMAPVNFKVILSNLALNKLHVIFLGQYGELII